MILSIIVPAYNEEELVGKLLQKLLELRFNDPLQREIIVIDDGSTDSTNDKVEEFIRDRPHAGVILIQHGKNKGKGAAVRTGIEACRGDIVIIQDADLEYEPQDIHQVISPILSRQENVVYGSRILREKELGRSGKFGLITGKHPHSYVLAYLGGVTITKLINLLTGSRLTDEPTCYKCFQRSVIREMKIENDDFAWEPEITMRILRAGINIAEVPVAYYPRKRKQGKKISWKDGIKALWTVWRFR